MRYASLYDLLRDCPDEAAAAAYFQRARWPGGIRCPHCDSDDTIRVKNSKPMPLRCRSCRRFFSVRTDTVMADSKLGLHQWLVASYLMFTSRKGASSVFISKLLGVTQKTAWFLCHRIRQAMAGGDTLLSDVVEVDETYVGGREANKHFRKRLDVGGGTSGKQPVIGMRERGGHIRAYLIKTPNRETIHAAVRSNVAHGSSVFTDALSSYTGIPGRAHAPVAHHKGEYVRGEVHTNGIEAS